MAMSFANGGVLGNSGQGQSIVAARTKSKSLILGAHYQDPNTGDWRALEIRVSADSLAPFEVRINGVAVDMYDVYVTESE